MAEEFHVAGLVVHALPPLVARVREALAALPGAEVHAESPEGKLVVTLESLGSAAITDHLNTIQRLDGVLSAVVVYQHSEDLESLDEEI